MRKIIVLSIVLLLISAIFFGCKLTRAGYESPDYKRISKDGPFELRDYPSMIVATTPMDSADPEAGSSFMRLFRYISGENEAEQKIAMTSPVLISQNMTNRQMSFIMSKKVADQGAPPAKEKDVRIENKEGGRFAVYRFSGSWKAEKSEAAKKKLAAWMAQRNMKPIGDMQLANYDPPFTPPFLRRNEVMARVEAKSEVAQ